MSNAIVRSRRISKISRISFFADGRPQAHGPRVVDRHHDLAVGVEDAQDVELLALAGDVLLFDGDDFGDALGGVDRLVADLEQLLFGTGLHFALR